jgi:hypothetical protein
VLAVPRCRPLVLEGADDWLVPRPRSSVLLAIFHRTDVSRADDKDAYHLRTSFESWDLCDEVGTSSPCAARIFSTSSVPQ